MKNFDGRVVHTIDGDIWKGRKYQFACTLLASDTTAMREGGKKLDSLKDHAYGS